VAINGGALFREDVSEALLPALKGALGRVADKNGSVDFELHFTTRELQAIDTSRRRLWERLLKQLALDAGFRDARVGTNGSIVPWQDRLSTTSAKPGDAADAEENGEGDDRARAYAVRTPLSRYLAIGADCVVNLEDVVREGEIDAGLRRSIESAIAQVELPRRDLLVLRARLSDPRSGVEQLRERVKELAAALGFERGRVRGVLNRR
jgi:hypothetical protein